MSDSPTSPTKHAAINKYVAGRARPNKKDPHNIARVLIKSISVF